MSFKDVDVDTFVAANMKEYGHAVLGDRALPDYRDGLKPVQRRILETMYQEGINSRGGFKKCARTVGTTMAVRHAHGDLAIYGAMTNMMHPPFRLIEGSGNIGDHVSPPAAMRYLESRLDKNSDSYLLDANYLAVTETVSNFDGSARDYVYLPSKIPLYLMLEHTGIAVGISTRIPAFSLHSLLKVMNKALEADPENPKVTPKMCLPLRFRTYGGGKILATESQLLEFYKTGKQKFTWTCVYTEDEKGILISGLAPDWNFVKRSEKIRALQGVSSVMDETNKDGLRIRISFGRGSADAKEKMREQVKKLLQTDVSYSMFAIERTLEPKDEDPDHLKIQTLELTVPEFLTRWLAYRIDLEKRSLKYQISVQKSVLDKTNLHLLAIANLEGIVKIMKMKGLTGEQRVDKIGRLLKCSPEQANTVYSMSLRSLDAAGEAALKEKKKQTQENIETLQTKIKRPGKEIFLQFKSIIKGV